MTRDQLGGQEEKEGILWEQATQTEKPFVVVIITIMIIIVIEFVWQIATDRYHR